MAENRAFSFGEAVAWVKPAGLASQQVGFIRTYSLARTPVKTEDGSASFYNDELTVESPWVDDELVALFEAEGPLDFFFIRWLNEDDQRLASLSVTAAEIQNVGRTPGDGGVETFTFRLTARALK